MRKPRYYFEIPVATRADRERGRHALRMLLGAMETRVEKFSIDPQGSRDGLEDFEVEAAARLSALVVGRWGVTEPELDPLKSDHVSLFLNWCFASDLADIWLSDGRELFEAVDGSSAGIYVGDEDRALVQQALARSRIDSGDRQVR